MKKAKKVLMRKKLSYSLSIYKNTDKLISVLKNDIDLLLAYFKNGRFEAGQVYEHTKSKERIEIVKSLLLFVVLFHLDSC